MTYRNTTLLLLTSVLAGCAAVGPDYERPDVGVAENDVFGAADARQNPGTDSTIALDGAQGVPVTAPTAADLRWWRRFDDPEMARWVERALAGNLDVAVAFERVDQAQAVLRAASAGRAPVVGARGQSGISRRGSSGASGGTTGGTSGNSANGLGASAGLSIEWDPDLWGGLRQAESSAAASLLRSQDLAQAARLASAGATARGFIEMRESQHERQALQQTLRLREDLLRIVRARVDAGLAPALDATRAEADVAAVRAELDDATGRVRQAALALQLLAGERPSAGAGVAGVATAADPTGAPPPIPQVGGDLPLARPIDLLRLRPDVRAAERALIATYADIGVAEAALYPRLRLPGELLLTAAGLGTGSIVSAMTASLSALVDAALLDGGRRRADLDAARSRAREATLVYQRTVYEALEQVESALIANQTVRSQLAAREAATRASATALEQARALYTEGLAGFGDVLDAQRNWLTNRVELARGEAAAGRAAVSMFEAIGLVDPNVGNTG